MAGPPISLSGTLEQLEWPSHPEWAAPMHGLVPHSSAGHTDSDRQKNRKLQQEPRHIS